MSNYQAMGQLMDTITFKVIEGKFLRGEGCDNEGDVSKLFPLVYSVNCFVLLIILVRSKRKVIRAFRAVS